MNTLLSTDTYPHAILHVDGDSFFASCEQARNPRLAGKPVVVGKERGIATAISTEAKEAGITRGMQIHEVKKRCPDCHILAADYEYYSMVSARMFAIVRRYTPDVEEYSIDECFAEITGLRSMLNMSYREIAENIKEDLMHDLGVTFSVGVGPTKVVAKIASTHNKPDGFTMIPAKHIHTYLEDMPTEKLWGIGKRTAHKLNTKSITTALDLANKSREWVVNNLNQPRIDIWHELHGRLKNPVRKETQPAKSITRSRTFNPPSSERAKLLSRIADHLEDACHTARRYQMYTDTVSFFIKDTDFNIRGKKLTLTQKTNTPSNIMHAIRRTFGSIHDTDKKYRTVGVRLGNLEPYESLQRDLFGQHTRLKERSDIFETVDNLNDLFGSKTVRIARSLEKEKHTKETRDKNSQEASLSNMNIPFLGTVR